MKKSTFILAGLFFTFIQVTSQQNKIVSKQRARNNALWLQNSKGEIATLRDSIISKSFFDSRWVIIQSTIPFSKDAKFLCVFDSNDSTDMNDAAYYFNDAKLKVDLLKRIKTQTHRSHLFISVKEYKGEADSYKSNRRLSFAID